MELKVAEQAWIAGAILQKENPGRDDFSVDEIRRQACKEFGDLRPGVYQHIVNHGLAQAKPAPSTLRLFTQTARGRRRLFRPGDQENRERKNGKTHPEASALPEKYRGLVDWYEHSYVHRGAGAGAGTAPAGFVKFVGLIPAFDLEQLRTAIERDCERVEDDAQQ